MSKSSPILIRGIIPAAGAGRRFTDASVGQEPAADIKQLALIGGKPMLVEVMDLLEKAEVNEIICVVSTAIRQAICTIRPATPKRLYIINDRPTGPMLESVQMGLAAALGQPLEQSERATGGKTVGYLICPGDCPYITPKAVRRCLAAFADRPETITVAAHLGIRGHPIILPKDVACLVASWPLTERLDSLSGRYAGRFQQVETGESGVLADVDRPKDIIE